MANEIARWLRKNRTTAEQVLWSKLRELKQADYRFRQQAPIDRFVVDFVCFGERLIIEVDGATHTAAEQLRKDSERDRYFVGQGFWAVRFWNDDVLNNIDGVMDGIVRELEASTPTPRRNGGGATKRLETMNRMSRE